MEETSILKHKKNPLSAATEKRGTSGDLLDRKKPTSLLFRYAMLKTWNCRIGAMVGQLGRLSESERLKACGRYIAFRQYLDNGKVKFVSGNFCNLHLLCPCCAAARSRRMLATWLPRIFCGKPATHYMATFTWPPPAGPLAVAVGPGGDIYNLRRNLAVGLKGWSKLWERRKRRGNGPLKPVLGAIVSVEVTRGPSGAWHPHLHVLLTTGKGYKNRVDVVQLREDFFKLTGGKQVNLKYLAKETDVVEVLKYAVKPADLDKNGNVSQAAIADRITILDALRGRRLLRGYGIYYGATDPDLDQPEDVQDIGDWVDLIFEWTGKNYNLVKEIPNV